MRRAGIVGLGMYVPPKVLTNRDLERMVDTSDEWIRQRTGIEERHIADPGVGSSDLGVQAARAALADAGCGPEDLDLILVATTTPDQPFPTTAVMVQKGLEAWQAGAVDVGATCSGFIYGLSLATSMVESGRMNKVLVIGAETLSRITNWKDRATCVLFGDGAGAAVVGEVSQGGIQAFELGADARGTEFLNVWVGGFKKPVTAELLESSDRYINMTGREVFKFAVRTMEESVRRVADRAWGGLEVDLLVPHQANARIIEAVGQRLGLADKAWINIQHYGNTSAASIPMALTEARDAGRLSPGTRVAITAFGGGFTYASAALEWV
ncbi:3-oxoacyl-ACP synthase [Kyrpidia spormannii]|uniref:Beta-ketoacyl-[acyl-carrier-protein] synthase III n=1 Tax=Kyrpidia spormannii TaxID=2055160 RepID=A0A2K8N3U5_9BACL|nr:MULTISPECIES: beta-ketoacyl-ACP synthase III [Kyrpidia]ATY83597.1 3-oxoacyl-ACP synthase [Kyrpidia spormannii]MCL6576655.1 ketoacyl-ACP synthase III [Kyrpidia sp.]CAB3389694.1 beta-ketoacyl-acyl carrier protein synthase III 1 [Kyrpidia spormannii]HHY66798.1 ketoacyl-ACP synthase III [Alicyclobacillus sp.]